MKDIYSGLGLAAAVAPAVLSATNTSSEIDLQGFTSAMLVIATGAIAASGDFTAKLQESDTTTSGDFTDVAASDLLGILPATLEASSTYRQGYIGTKRYLRTVMTKNGGTSIAASAVIVKGHPDDAPVA